MSQFYEHTIRLTGMDADGRGICKPSALLDHLQIAAGFAAEEGGFGRETLVEKYGAFWMLARSWFHLDRPLRWEDRLTIRTWHRGGKAAMMYRDYDIYANGELVGESVSGWVLANLESRKIMRLADIQELAGTGGGELCKTRTLNKLRAPKDLKLLERRKMHYSDTDVNGHVNNTRYADFACDAVELDKLPEDQFLTEMQIGYLAECRPGEILDLEAGALDGGCYVHGLDQNGKARFETAMIFKQLDS